MLLKSFSMFLLTLLLGMGLFPINLQAQWGQTNGPEGAVVQALTVFGTDLYAGTFASGIFRSTDDGTSWTSVNNGMTGIAVYAFAVSGTNIFAGTWNGASGVYLSNDNGANWTLVNNGLTNTAVYSLLVNGSNLFAGTNDGVFLSTNNGTLWIHVSTGMSYGIVIQALAVNSNYLFAGTGEGVFRSSDNGTSWTLVNSGLSNLNIKSFAVNGSNLFVGTYGGGVFLSTNDGSNWNSRSSGLNNYLISALSVSGTDLFAGTNDGVCISTNNGTNWTTVNSGLASIWIRALAVSGTNLFAGTAGGGVFRSINNGTLWTSANGNMIATRVLSLAVIGTNIFAGTEGAGVFSSTDQGANWNAMNTGLTNREVLTLYVSGSNLFAGTGGGGIFRSTNNGTTWTSVNIGITNYTVWALTATGSNLFAGSSGGGVYLSTNDGDTWTPVNTGLTTLYISCLAVNGTNLFAGTRGSGVFRSTNNGTNWTAVNTGLTNGNVFAFAVIGGNVFAGTGGGGVFLSNDNGASWAAVNNGINHMSVSSLAVSGTNLFAGTDGGGISLSNNNGTNWTDFSSGMPDIYPIKVVRALAFIRSDFFAGTYGGAVWKQTLSGGSISGNVFNDPANVCVQNQGEYDLQGRVLLLDPGNRYAITNANGEYTFSPVNPGSYTITLLPKQYWQQTCPANDASISLNLGMGQAITDMDFGVQANQSVQDLTVNIWATYPFPLRSPCCGQPLSYVVRYENVGSVPVSGATMRLLLSPHIAYQSFSSTPMLTNPSTAGGPNSLTWNLPDPLQPGSSGLVYVNGIATCVLPSTPMIVTQARINPLPGDANAGDNIMHNAEKALCSFDPNDKAVVPKGCGSEGFITADDSLTYTIQFQNLGTGPAYLVVVRDTLDNDVDISTVNNLGSSHSYVFEILGRELKWTFPDVVLAAASDDEPASHGFVKFSVHQNVGNSIGTVIQNRGGIYFDLNDVVLTNTTTNTITNTPIPQASFTVLQSCEPQPCTYDFTYIGGTTGATFLWNFGYGAVPETSSVQNPQGIYYLVTGDKIVSLQVLLGECSSEPAIEYFTDSTGTVTVSTNQNDGWNLASIPVIPDDYSKSTLFPTAISKAFTFEGGYITKDTLENGRGYWLKFNDAQTVQITGTSINFDTIEFKQGWNIVGSISTPVAVTDIATIPDSITTSQFFAYNNSYFIADTVEPGQGYWFKASHAGKLILSSSGFTSSQNRIRIVPITELPPPPPDGEISNLESQIPKSFSLEQNYPNPFNPATTIRFELPFDAKVTLKVYNVLGRELSTLANEMHYDVGNHQLEFIAGNLTSGLYYYRISAQGVDGKSFTDVKKMILLK